MRSINYRSLITAIFVAIIPIALFASSRSNHFSIGVFLGDAPRLGIWTVLVRTLIGLVMDSLERQGLKILSLIN